MRRRKEFLKRYCLLPLSSKFTGHVSWESGEAVRYSGVGQKKKESGEAVRYSGVGQKKKKAAKLYAILG